MNPKENYLHEFFRIFFANKQLVKRVFLVFAVIALLLPLLLKQSFDITAQVIVQSKKTLSGRCHYVAHGQENATFIPPSLADMETESNILRSPALIRQTISELRDNGEYSPPPGRVRQVARRNRSNGYVINRRSRVRDQPASRRARHWRPIRYVTPRSTP